MSYYNEEDLRDFVKYAEDYLKNNKLSSEEKSPVRELINIIVTIRYNAMLLESYIATPSALGYTLSIDLKSLPLLNINKKNLLDTIIIKWRLQRNK